VDEPARIASAATILEIEFTHHVLLPLPLAASSASAPSSASSSSSSASSTILALMVIAPTTTTTAVTSTAVHDALLLLVGSFVIDEESLRYPFLFGFFLHFSLSVWGWWS
jgi:hypothetical protein